MASTLSVTLTAAAQAVAESWSLADQLTVGEPGRDTAAAPFTGQALVVNFTGALHGELLIAVDAELAQALLQAPTAPADLPAALTPAVTSACLAIGDVTAGTAQTTEVAVALRRVAEMDDWAAVTLSDADHMRAIVAIGTHTAAAVPAAERLDMLRGVQMQVTVELGRATMTVNDLLSLRSGAVVELDRAAGAPADLYVNGRLLAHGEVVVVDENYGLRIQQVVSDDMDR